MAARRPLTVLRPRVFLLCVSVCVQPVAASPPVWASGFDSSASGSFCFRCVSVTLARFRPAAPALGEPCVRWLDDRVRFSFPEAQFQETRGEAFYLFAVRLESHQTVPLRFRTAPEQTADSQP
ncbi:hypothetical protein SRHO_G00326410 [Serrasalmus rhombeus]